MDRSIDKQDMYGVLESFPNQVKDGWALGKDIQFKDIDKIIVAGMGGSALSGEILKCYLSDELKIPLEINKNYTLPKYADEKTLVVISSYSGNTEETIEAFREANRKGCQVLCVASGGKLIELAKQMHKPLVELPEGFQPRMACGYSFFAVLKIIQNSNLIKNQVEEVRKVFNTLKKDIYKKKAQELAEKLKNKIPLIYSSERLHAVAYKWKIDFNENAKIHSFCNYFPELNHNEMIGYTNLNGNYFVIIIRDDYDDSQVKKRMDITKKLIQDKKCPALDIDLAGLSFLTKIFATIYLGDWTSYFLAINNSTDPTPVDMVEELKKKLK
jgi:glucose/mannose-6-phosphate isomerase